MDQSAAIWYSKALEVLQPLRLHLDEVIKEIEAHNRFCVRVGQIGMANPCIDAARDALNAAEAFFTQPKAQKEDHATADSADCGSDNQATHPVS